MAEFPFFLYGLNVNAGAIATLTMVYGHAPWEDVKGYLLGQAPPPFAWCSKTRLVMIYRASRKKSAVYEDLDKLEAVGAIKPAERVIDGVEHEGWLLPLRSLPDGTVGICQYRGIRLSIRNSAPAEKIARPSRRQDSAPPETKSAPPERFSAPPEKSSAGAERNSSFNDQSHLKRNNSEAAAAAGSVDRRERGDLVICLLESLRQIWSPIDEFDRPAPHKMFNPESVQVQAMANRLLVKLAARGLNAEQAAAYVLDTAGRFAEVCGSTPKKRKWWGPDMLESEPRHGTKSRWETVELDAAAVRPPLPSAPVPEHDVRALEARWEEDELSRLIHELDHPPTPNDFEKRAWHMVPAYRRAQLFEPLKAQAAGRMVLAEAAREGRRPTLAKLKFALASIEVDPDLADQQPDGEEEQ